MPLSALNPEFRFFVPVWVFEILTPLPSNSHTSICICMVPSTSICTCRASSRTLRRYHLNSQRASVTTKQGPPEHNYNTNSAYNYLVEDRASVFDEYALVTARSLAQHARQPRRVKMLAREFIDDALYNPRYGYFSKQAVILSPSRGFEFNEYRDNADFQSDLSLTFQDFEGSIQDKNPTAPRQVWQTPTEMFKPFYGQAVASYLLTQYKLTSYPYHDLVLYEVGAGNGTLMLNVLDFIRETEPEIYKKTRYKIIEISGQLAKRQNSALSKTADKQGHGDKVEIINKSIFDWDTVVPGPCFFLAMEVFDNFAHDAIRFDLLSGQPYQALVAIDEAGDYHELLTPNLDPVTQRYLKLRSQTSRMARSADENYLHPSLKVPHLLRQVRSKLPFAPNLTSPEFIPTKLLQFMDILHSKFPQHRLLASDFHTLPDAMEGVNAPVVQTRYKGTMVPCSTYLVYPGYFDIMFPTDFRTLNRIYSELANQRSGYFSHVRHRTGLKGRISSHRAFLEAWGDTDATRTRSGENPMLDFYENASFITT